MKFGLFFLTLLVIPPFCLSAAEPSEPTLPLPREFCITVKFNKARDMDRGPGAAGATGETAGHRGCAISTGSSSQCLSSPVVPVERVSAPAGSMAPSWPGVTSSCRLIIALSRVVRDS